MSSVPPWPEDRDQLASELTARGQAYLPGTLGMELVSLEEGRATMRCAITGSIMALNGYLHAGSIIALADTAAGYGCLGNRPKGAIGFTTMEIKSNHVSTLTEGVMVAEARMLHGGRTTQLWDVIVSDEASGRPLAHYRATQLLLYPRD